MHSLNASEKKPEISTLFSLVASGSSPDTPTKTQSPQYQRLRAFSFIFQRFAGLHKSAHICTNMHILTHIFCKKSERKSERFSTGNKKALDYSRTPALFLYHVVFKSLVLKMHSPLYQTSAYPFTILKYLYRPCAVLLSDTR